MIFYYNQKLEKAWHIAAATGKNGFCKNGEAIKQVAYVNYTLNEFKELSQNLGDFMFVDNCKPQQCFVMFWCLVVESLLVQSFFSHWSVFLEL